jgi:hypothetical protein
VGAERVGENVTRLCNGVWERGGEVEGEGGPAAVGVTASAREALAEGVLTAERERGAVAGGVRVRGEALGEIV